MKLIQVFDWLDMPPALGEIYQDFVMDEDYHNGSYIRWYPDNGRMLEPDEVEKIKQINDWLYSNGMVHSNEEYFYVLVYISW